MKKKQVEKPETVKVVLPIEEESQQLLQVAEQTKNEMHTYYTQMLQEEIPFAEVQGKADSLKRAGGNITKALAQTYLLSDELGARGRDIKKQKKKKKLLKAAPANASIDLKEKTSEHFAKGLNAYKLLLVCFMGCFIGVIVELLWCLAKNGYLESRSGLVYGPFNPVYGIGAVALTLSLYYFRNRSSWISFVGGTIVGAVVEYACSWAQEMAFGSRSWDYSAMPFNINGRICLLYSFFWGFLGVLWIKELYPRIAKWILKIPNRAGKIITWVLVAFFVFNATVSGIAVFRWSQRVKDVAPSNGFWEFIDERFPDERMEGIYANLRFSE